MGYSRLSSHNRTAKRTVEKALNEEQTKAQQRVDDAVQDLILSHAPTDDLGSRMVSEYALVAHVVSIGADGHRYMSYQMILPNDTLDDHHVIGLMEMGKRLIFAEGREL